MEAGFIFKSLSFWHSTQELVTSYHTLATIKCLTTLNVFLNSLPGHGSDLGSRSWTAWEGYQGLTYPILTIYFGQAFYRLAGCRNRAA